MVDPPEKTGSKQGARFQPGQSGNPAGRPRGSRNRTTIAVEALLDGEAEAITRKAIEKAKKGDLAALRLCMDRILPPRKDRPITFAFPKIEKAEDAVSAMAAIALAVAQGNLTPGEAAELARVLDGWARTVEALDFEQRLSRLERMKDPRA